MTSKERAELRAQANTIDTTLIVGKGGVSETLVAEAEKLLDIHELVKGRVLETAMLTPREVSDALCEATGADGIQVVGSKFVRSSRKKRRPRKRPLPPKRSPATITRSRPALRSASSRPRSAASSRRNTSMRRQSRRPSNEESSRKADA